MGPVHLQGVPVGFSGGMIGAGNLIAHPEGVFGVQVQDVMIFYVNLRHPIVGGGEQEVEVETDFPGAWFECAVPVGPFGTAQAQVPFADDSGFVAGRFHNGSDGFRFRLNDGGTVGRSNARVFLAKRVGAGEKGITRGGCKWRRNNSRW